MSAPQPPRDPNVRSVIDRLAEFVARNGAEFEQMTIVKQQNNSKFSFLNSNSEYHQYYQFRKMEERRSLMGTSTAECESEKY